MAHETTSEPKQFPFEKVAKLDSDERKEQQPTEPLVRLITKRNPGDVLDVGVGTGYFLIPVAKALPECRVWGLDVEPKMLEIFMKKVGEAGVERQAKSVEAPSDRIPMLDQSVDVVLMVHLYHELGDREAHLREVCRVLRPKGSVVVCDYRMGAPEDHGPPKEHRVAEETAKEELKRAGLQGLQSYKIYDSTYVLTAEV